MREQISCRGPPPHGAEEEKKVSLEIYRLGGARWIHVDTALPMNRRTWPGFHRQFKEDSYRHGADDEWENLA